MPCAGPRRCGTSPRGRSSELMTGTHFEHATPILRVEDRARGVHYYRDVLGFALADWSEARVMAVPFSNPRTPMERNPKRALPLVALLFIIGVAVLSRFSPDVRAVDAVGLSGSGFALGVGFTILVFALTGRARS